MTKSNDTFSFKSYDYNVLTELSKKGLIYSKIITIDKVLKNLKISRATFYRLKKKYQK